MDEQKAQETVKEDHFASAFSDQDIEKVAALLEPYFQGRDVHFTKRELAVLGYRFGLIDGNPHTLEESEAFFGVRRERIRYIENRAVRRMRPCIPQRSKTIEDYYSDQQ